MENHKKEEGRGETGSGRNSAEKSSRSFGGVRVGELPSCASEALVSGSERFSAQQNNETPVTAIRSAFPEGFLGPRSWSPFACNEPWP